MTLRVAEPTERMAAAASAGALSSSGQTGSMAASVGAMAIVPRLAGGVAGGAAVGVAGGAAGGRVRAAGSGPLAGRATAFVGGGPVRGATGFDMGGIVPGRDRVLAAGAALPSLRKPVTGLPTGPATGPATGRVTGFAGGSRVLQGRADAKAGRSSGAASGGLFQDRRAWDAGRVAGGGDRPPVLGGVGFRGLGSGAPGSRALGSVAGPRLTNHGRAAVSARLMPDGVASAVPDGGGIGEGRADSAAPTADAGRGVLGSVFPAGVAAPEPSPGAGNGGGAVMLDGRLVGRLIAERMGREAERAPAGMTRFDARQSAAWRPSGAM